MHRKSKTKHEAKEGEISKEGQQVDSTEGLVPVPQENAFKKLFSSKLILVSALALSAAIAIFLFLPQKSILPQSHAQITTTGNSFKLNFELQNSDDQNISQLLEKLQLSQDIKKGVTFELDSTSSAQLAFANPVSVNIQSQQGKISISGTTQTPLINSQLTLPANYKILQNTLFSVFAANLIPQVQKQVDMPAQLENWISQNLDSPNGQLLQLLPEGNFVLSLNSQKEPDFTALAKLKFPNQIESPYIQQVENDVNIHLVKIAKKEGDETLAFFKIGDQTYIASSVDVAKQIIAVQKEDAPSYNFPKTEGKISAAIILKNPENKDIDLSIFGPGAKKLEKYFKNLKEGQLVLSGTQISGYISY